MKLPFFNFNKSKDNSDVINENDILLALDVGTEYVKSVIFQIREGVIHVVGYSRVPQHSKAMEGAMIINIDNVVNACDIGIGRALAVADKTLGKKADAPEYVVMGIAGELVKGVSIVANYDREEPEMPITHDELNDVMTSVKEQAFPDSIEEIAEEIGSSADKIKEISSSINSTYIDGVKVDNPEGFTGGQVSYRVYSTFAPALHINSLYEIANRLELKVLGIDVQPYAIARSFKGSHRSDFSSIFIDIGGGTTDIALVQNGGIIGTKMIGFGARVFTRRISNDMKLEMADAEKMKIDYSQRKLQATTETKIKSILARDVQLWAESVEICLNEFDEIEEFPTEIYICGGGSELPDLKEALLAYPWLATIPILKFPKISHIYPSQIQNIEDHTGLLTSSADVTPASLASIAISLIDQVRER